MIPIQHIPVINWSDAIKDMALTNREVSTLVDCYIENFPLELWPLYVEDVVDDLEYDPLVAKFLRHIHDQFGKWEYIVIRNA